MLTRFRFLGRWSGMVLKMSTEFKFYLKIVKESLYKCNPRVGRWSKMGKIWST
jgi:hypothetical protein